MALLYSQIQFFDNAGNPLANGYIYTYQAGTTTPQATYTDSTGGTPLPNPIRTDSNGFVNPGSGECGIWLGTTNNYKIKVYESDNLTQVGPTLDNISGIGNTLSFYSTLNHNLDTNNYALVTTAGNYNIVFSPNGSGIVHNTNNEQIDGTLTVTGGVIASSTLNSVGNFSVNTNKFNVTAASGNTAVAGTLSCVGLTDTGNPVVGVNAGTLTINSGNTTPASIILQTNSGTKTSTITSANAQSSNLSWTLPSAGPSVNNAVVLTSTTGVLSSSTTAFELAGVRYLGQVALSGAATSITSLITSTYDCYKLVFDTVQLPALADTFAIQVSGDNGSTFKSTNYASMYNISYNATTAQVTSTSNFPIALSNATFAGILGGEITLSGVNTSQYMMVSMSLTNGAYTTTPFVGAITGGGYFNQGIGPVTVNAIRLYMVGLSGSCSGTVRIYGYRNS